MVAALAAVAVALIVVLLWNQGKHLIAGESGGAAAYLVIGLLVFGDAVVPVLPGETTLNAGAVLSSTGHLSIWLVAAAGAVGAITGDSTLYWIARRAKGRVRGWLDKVADGERTGAVVGFVERRGPVFLLFGRYIPGVRFALNVALGGVIRMPYGRFLAWSALSGVLWASYTCASAYFISVALNGYPVLSLIVTGVLSSALIALVFWGQGRWNARSGAKPGAQSWAESGSSENR